MMIAYASFGRAFDDRVRLGACGAAFAHADGDGYVPGSCRCAQTWLAAILRNEDKRFHDGLSFRRVSRSTARRITGARAALLAIP